MVSETLLPGEFLTPGNDPRFAGWINVGGPEGQVAGFQYFCVYLINTDIVRARPLLAAHKGFSL
ncbi:hypothetical protein ROS1_09320 [Roseibium sp. ROS1]